MQYSFPRKTGENDSYEYWEMVIRIQEPNRLEYEHINGQWRVDKASGDRVPYEEPPAEDGE